MAACAKCPSARSRSCACSRRRTLLRREPGARAVQARAAGRRRRWRRRARRRAAGRAARAARARSSGGHLAERPAAARRGRPPVPAGRARGRARPGHPRPRRSSRSRRARRRPAAHPRRSAAASSSPTPRLEVRVGVAPLVRDQRRGRRPAPTRRRPSSPRAGPPPGRARRPATSTVTGTSSPPSADVQGRDEAGAAVGERAGRSPRRAAPPCARPRRWSRRPRRPSGSSRSCRGR